jgi:hypothetical protein
MQQTFNSQREDTIFYYPLVKHVFVNGKLGVVVFCALDELTNLNKANLRLAL